MKNKPMLSPWAFYDEDTGEYKIANGSGIVWTWPPVSGTIGLSRTGSLLVFVARGTLAHTDTSNKTLFSLPANAVILDVILHVTTLFDDTGTDVLDVGTTVGDPDEYVDALACGAVGVNRCGDNGDMPATARGSVGGSAVTVLGKYTGQNSNAAQGAATIEIIYTIA